MPTSDLGNLRHTQTSPGGTARRSSLATAIAAIVLVAPSLEPATANTYELPSFFVRTASGPDGQIVPVPSESTGEAVLEIRRRSGLTWEQLGKLFDVSRRSVHHWASGKAVTPEHERMIRRMLASIRRLDQGSQAATRARLLAVDERFGFTVLDLLKEGRFGEAGGAGGWQTVTGVSPDSALRGSSGCTPSSGTGVASGGRSGTPGHPGQGPHGRCRAGTQEDGLMLHAIGGRGREGGR